jgi:hypothetical protein
MTAALHAAADARRPDPEAVPQRDTRRQRDDLSFLLTKMKDPIVG